MLSNLLRYTVTAALGITPVALWAQAAQPAAVPVTLPLAGVHYRYWSEQLVQWIGPELPYSMIVLDVDDRGKQPVYDVELIDKTGAKVVHYTNTAAQLATDQKTGFTVHQVAMQFDGPADPSKGAQYMLRFNTETGVPVVWQFVLGSDVTEQGSGLTPIAAPVPVMLYREQGGLAGEGTAIQIGGVTSTAEVWQQYAQPPYFVPYHGALSTGIHVLSFAPGVATWKQDAQKLTDQAGNTLSLAKDGDTVAMTNDALGVTASYTLTSTNISRVSLGPVNAKRDDTVSLQFSPALTPGAQSSFELIAGKKNKIASGTVQTEAAANGAISETWSFSAPDALHGKKATATVSLQP
jgi:hypothetical protein